jgi:molybdenum cofactor biosynthesis enzyme MoaA
VNVFTDGLGWPGWPNGGAHRPNRLHFSVDTLDADRHREVRGNTGLARVLDNIEEALARRIPCRLMSTVVPGHIIDAFNVVEWVAARWANNLPIDHRMYLVHDYGKFDVLDLKDAGVMAMEVLRRHGNAPWHNAVAFLGAIHRQGEVYRPVKCVIPYIHRVVAADGLVFGCCFANRDNAAWSAELEAERLANALGRVEKKWDADNVFARPTRAVMDRYWNVALGAPCEECASVNSRYAELNRAWNLKASDAPAYV